MKLAQMTVHSTKFEMIDFGKIPTSI